MGGIFFLFFLPPIQPGSKPWQVLNVQSRAISGNLGQSQVITGNPPALQNKCLLMMPNLIYNYVLMAPYWRLKRIWSLFCILKSSLS